MLIIVGAGTRKGVSTSETMKKMGVKDQNLLAGSNLGSLGFYVSFFLYPCRHETLTY